MTDRSFLTAILIAGLVLAFPVHSQAQGNGRPKGPRNGTTAAPVPTTSSPTSTAPTTGTATGATPADLAASTITFRQFGSWLDDASAATAGQGYMSIGVGYWRLSGVSQINMPMLGAGLGVTDRVQVSASVPFYNVRYEGGSTRGLDDVYLGAKYTLVDPTLTVSEFGLAVSPVVEVLSPGVPDGRVHFAVPVSMELRRSPFRIYGSAGYFTRGSVFTGGALEWTTPAWLVLTGMLTQSYSVKDDPVLDGLLVGRQQVDVMGSAAYPLGTRAAAYASVGRSLRSPYNGGTRLALSGGVSFRFAR